MSWDDDGNPYPPAYPGGAPWYPDGTRVFPAPAHMVQGERELVRPPLSPAQYAEIVQALEQLRRLGTPSQFPGFTHLVRTRDSVPQEVARWELPIREMYTVSVQREDVPPILTAGAPPIQIVGICKFGAGNVQSEFEFDWVNDSLFSVPAQSIKVLARVDNPGAGHQPSRVSVSLTPGARASPTSMRRTLISVTAAPVDLPRRTFAVSLWSSDLADYANMSMRFYDVRGGAPTAVVTPGGPIAIEVPWPSLQVDVVPIAGVLRGVPNIVCQLTC